MRFTLKRIPPFLLYRADSREEYLCESIHQPAEQAQEALGTPAGVMALDRHTDLDDAPAEDNHADGLDRRKDEIGQVVDHRDWVAAGGKGGGAEADYVSPKQLQEFLGHISQSRAGKVRICHQFLRMGWSDEAAAFYVCVFAIGREKTCCRNHDIVI